jgi:hypothetical protein
MPVDERIRILEVQKTYGSYESGYGSGTLVILKIFEAFLLQVKSVLLGSVVEP